MTAERAQNTARPSICRRAEHPGAGGVLCGRHPETGHAQRGGWIIHRPAQADLLKAAQLDRRYKLGWWDARILTSAIELGCAVLWTEDFSGGQRLGPITVRNPFR